MKYILILMLINFKKQIKGTQSFIGNNEEGLELPELKESTTPINRNLQKIIEYHNQNFFRQCFFLQIINLVEPLVKNLSQENISDSKIQIIEILQLFYSPNKIKILETFTKLKYPTTHILGDLIYKGVSQHPSLPLLLKIDILKFTLCLYEIPKKNFYTPTYNYNNNILENKQFHCYLDLIKYTRGTEKDFYTKCANDFFLNLNLHHRKSSIFFFLI